MDTTFPLLHCLSVEGDRQVTLESRRYYPSHIATLLDGKDVEDERRAGLPPASIELVVILDRGHSWVHYLLT